MNHTLPRHPLCALALMLAFATVALPPVSAAPGDLDFTFGIGGKVTTAIAADAEGRSVAVQSDGKIVVAGYAFNGSNYDFAVARYNVDGTLDNDFGTGGKMTTDFDGKNDYGTILVLQADGKIIVSGSAMIDSRDFALVRYNADGTLDGGFGIGGKVVTDFGQHDGASSVSVEGNGMIVVVGTVDRGPNGIESDFGLVRYNTNGTPDSGFGAAGKVTTDFSGFRDYGARGWVQSDGRIVVVGVTNTQEFPQPVSDVALVRYNTDGTLDSGFGNGGKMTTDFGSSIDLLGGAVLQADGKILAVANLLNTPNQSVALARYNLNGALDGSFGTNGKVTLDFGSIDSAASGVVLQADGKIVVAGTYRRFDAMLFDFALIRRNADGTVDSGFGSGGKVTTSFGSFLDVSTGVAVQGDSKIIVAGFTTDGERRISFDGSPESGFANLAVARYYAGEPVPPLTPPVFDTETTSAAGTDFRNFRSPAVDGGQVGGLATVAGINGNEIAAYGGADGALLVKQGGLDPEGSTFLALGDPVFGGEAVGFAGTARVAPAAALRDWQMDRRLGSERMPGARPGGRLAALYSQLSAIGGFRRLAVQTGLAPGTDGQFARFDAFGLPRGRGGLIFTARLHHSGTVRRGNDFGVWRERPAGEFSELLLRIGSRLGGSLAPAGALRARGADDPRTVEKLSLLGPVTNATDQRRSFAPDGGVAAAAEFDDDTEGVVFVAADGSVDVPVDTNTPVPDEDGAPVAGIEFTAFSQPATASGGRFALASALRAVQQGVPPPPGIAVFANRDGTLRRVLARDDTAPGREGMRLAGLGQPLLGERGMIGLIAALTGQRVPPTGRKAIVLVEDKVKAVAARLGEQASGFDDGAVYRRFLSVVVTDSDPARLVFTATASGPGVTAGSNLGLWSVSTASGVNLLLRTGQEITIGSETLKVRSFDALKAPPKSKGQGRSTDEDGFVTAKATLSDGRKGVLRIPLP